MASAWVYQDDKQVAKVGTGTASWYVGWYNPEGKRRCKSMGPGARGKDRAERERRKIESDIMCGRYREEIRATWQTFRQDFERKILSGLSVRSRDEASRALAHFERIINPGRVFAVGTGTIDEYIAARRKEPGKKPGELVSPATINKELRHLKAAFKVAHEWGQLPTVPKVRMERTAKKLPTYVTGDHFAAMYEGCAAARLPRELPTRRRTGGAPCSSWAT